VSILVTLICGVVVGAVAKAVMPGRDPGGLAVTMVLGVAGALVAGLIGHSLGWYTLGEGPGLIASVLGAVLILATYRFTLRVE